MSFVRSAISWAVSCLSFTDCRWTMLSISGIPFPHRIYPAELRQHVLLCTMGFVLHTYFKKELSSLSKSIHEFIVLRNLQYSLKTEIKQHSDIRSFSDCWYNCCTDVLVIFYNWCSCFRLFGMHLKPLIVFDAKMCVRGAKDCYVVLRPVFQHRSWGVVGSRLSPLVSHVCWNVTWIGKAKFVLMDPDECVCKTSVRSEQFLPIWFFCGST